MGKNILHYILSVFLYPYHMFLNVYVLNYVWRGSLKFKCELQCNLYTVMIWACRDPDKSFILTFNSK